MSLAGDLLSEHRPRNAVEPMPWSIMFRLQCQASWNATNKSLQVPGKASVHTCHIMTHDLLLGAHGWRNAERAVTTATVLGIALGYHLQVVHA